MFENRKTNNRNCLGYGKTSDASNYVVINLLSNYSIVNHIRTIQQYNMLAIVFIRLIRCVNVFLFDIFCSDFEYIKY